MAGMGSVIAVLLGVHGWTMAAFVAAFCAGASPGWGNPLGAAFDKRPMGLDYEWWQVGLLRVYTLEALIFRGLIWTVPTLILAPMHLGILIFVPLAALALPLSVYLARELLRDQDYAWAMMEFGRGLLMGLAAYFGGVYG
ncbi:MAG: hypothetical protein ACYCZR_02635 [Burkholderiales bacterium]